MIKKIKIKYDNDFITSSDLKSSSDFDLLNFSQNNQVELKNKTKFKMIL
jgi:hypothetical protein